MGDMGSGSASPLGDSLDTIAGPRFRTCLPSRSADGGRTLSWIRLSINLRLWSWLRGVPVRYCPPRLRIACRFPSLALPRSRTRMRRAFPYLRSTIRRIVFPGGNVGSVAVEGLVTEREALLFTMPCPGRSSCPSTSTPNWPRAPGPLRQQSTSTVT